MRSKKNPPAANKDVEPIIRSPSEVPVSRGARRTSPPTLSTPLAKNNTSMGNPMDPETTGGSMANAKPTAAPSPRSTKSSPANVQPKSRCRAPETNPIPEASVGAQPRRSSPRETTSDEGQRVCATHPSTALVGNLIEETRRYEDLRRAKQRLELQAQSICRRYCFGDKVEGAKLYAKVKKGVHHDIVFRLIPFFAAMEPLDASIEDHAKIIAKMARQLPAWPWAEKVKGLSDRFLGLIVGECAAPVGEFKSVSAVWKRMGMAVINGGRQRKASGAAAIEHGYVARRRSLMWNIGEQLLRQQTRNPKDKKGQPIGDAYPIGPYGDVYHARKQYLRQRNDEGAYAERAAQMVLAAQREGKTPNDHNLAGRLSPSHIANDAKRYMEKRLLRDLYVAWRAADA